jgi:hypothetical protein
VKIECVGSTLLFGHDRVNWALRRMDCMDRYIGKAQTWKGWSEVGGKEGHGRKYQKAG